MKGLTPTPWVTRVADEARMGDSHADIAIISGDPSYRPGRKLIAEVYCRIQRDVCIDPGPNARLMAAAPDLLAALEGLVKIIDGLGPMDYPTLHEHWDAGRAAIAKARGIEDR